MNVKAEGEGGQNERRGGESDGVREEGREG